MSLRSNVIPHYTNVEEPYYNKSGYKSYYTNEEKETYYSRYKSIDTNHQCDIQYHSNEPTTIVDKFLFTIIVIFFIFSLYIVYNIVIVIKNFGMKKI